MIQAIKEILAINLNDDTAYDRIMEVFNRIEDLPIYTVPIIAGGKVYRSRQNNKKDFTSFSEISYPPCRLIKSFGRLNTPHQNLFYASDRFDTTITELMPNWLDIKTGEVITLTSSLWETTKSIRVIVIPDFYNPKMKEFIEGTDIKTLSNEQLEILEFINKLFRYNEIDRNLYYKATSAFCNSIKMNFENEIGGILYTSAQDKYGWNIAFESSQIDNGNVILKNVEKQFIRKTDYNPTYDNFTDPVMPKKIDFVNGIITW